MIEIKNYINGTWEASQTNATVPVYEPATRKSVRRLARFFPQDVELAYQARPKCVSGLEKRKGGRPFQILGTHRHPY